ncbi:MAG: hypothetical protein MI922_14640 [Bacteroidales bacterium]|nr:hypothetical protein [Bacteroidales bacterium]
MTVTHILRNIVKSGIESLDVDVKSQIINYLLGKQCENGLFEDRNGKGDLYYTYFAIECLNAAGITDCNDRTVGYLKNTQAIQDLDLVHLSCFGRILKIIGKDSFKNLIPLLLEELQAYEIPSGGYSLFKHGESESVYACFLVLMTYADLGIELKKTGRILENILKQEKKDGSYVEAFNPLEGTTTVTSAAVTIISMLKGQVSNQTTGWLMKQYTKYGGFLASPSTPIPDLLTTATVLSALYLTDYNFEPDFVENTYQFIETLWDDEGGFVGSIAETKPDVEYTYYGLLCIGILEGLKLKIEYSHA